MRVPAHAAVSETVALARSTVGAGAAQFVNAVLRRVSADSPDDWTARITEAAGPDQTARLAVVHSHPAWIVRALRQALVADGRAAEELSELLAADNAAPAVTLVARPGLVSADDLLRDVAGSTRGRWAPTAVTVPGGDPAAIDAVRQARAGAQVVATEIQPHRVLLVERSVAALPEGTVEVRCADGRDVGAVEPASYDRVLVDAPCTGLGALRRRPESRWRRSPEDLSPLTQLQRELLSSALDAVRPGGVVAYVTCSPHVAETRLVVGDVLRGRTDVEQLDAREAVRAVAGDAIPLGEGPAVQLWPHVHGTDAMHLVLLRRH